MRPAKSILFTLTLLLSLSGVLSHHEDGHIGGYSMKEIWAYGIVASFGISMLGVIIAGVMVMILRSKRPSSRGIKLTVMILIAFAVGALLGDSIVHIIPQIYRARTHDETTETTAIMRMLHNGVDHGTEETEETETETTESEAEPTASITSLLILVGFGSFILITKFFDWIGAPHTYWVNEKKINNNQESRYAKSELELAEANKMLGRANSETQQLEQDGKDVGHAVQVSGSGQYSAVAQNESQADWIQKGESSFLKTLFTSKGRKASGWTILLANFFHNIVDGLAIGGTFSTGNKDIAITTFIAVLAHQIPRGIGDMGTLIEAKFPIAQALVWRGLMNFSTIAGAAIGLGIGLVSEVANAYLLGFVTGTFLYLSLVCMMPALNSDTKGVKGLLFLGAFVVGAGFPFALLTVE